jgi:peptidoglycan/xylan/chitin deacetylase (PgdA/CDA1 family)
MDKLQLIARGLDQLGAQRVGRLARWSGLLVLNYHRIGMASGSAYDQALYSATQDSFAEQMAFLRQHFDVLGPQDLIGLAEPPKGRNVLVTFDDGYRDNYDLAFPVLRDQGVNATFFLTAGFLDDGLLAWWDEIAWMVRHATQAQLMACEWLPASLLTGPQYREATIRALLKRYKSLEGARCADFLTWLGKATGSGRCPSQDARQAWMTWDMVREMRDAGMVFGGHTVNHPVLARLSPDQQAAEIAGVGARLQTELGEKMRWFAYPVGGPDAFTEDTKQALQAAGVELAFSYYGGFNRAGQAWDRFNILRVPIEAAYDGARFRAGVCMPSLFGVFDQPLSTRLLATAKDWCQRGV